LIPNVSSTVRCCVTVSQRFLSMFPQSFSNGSACPPRSASATAGQTSSAHRSPAVALPSSRSPVPLPPPSMAKAAAVVAGDPVPAGVDRGAQGSGTSGGRFSLVATPLLQASALPPPQQPYPRPFPPPLARRPPTSRASNRLRQWVRRLAVVSAAAAVFLRQGTWERFFRTGPFAFWGACPPPLLQRLPLLRLFRPLPRLEGWMLRLLRPLQRSGMDLSRQPRKGLLLSRQKKKERRPLPRQLDDLWQLRRRLQLPRRLEQGFQRKHLPLTRQLGQLGQLDQPRLQQLRRLEQRRNLFLW
jgi:hypothetical protein